MNNVAYVQDEWEEEDEDVVGRAEKEREARIKLTAKVSFKFIKKPTNLDFVFFMCISSLL